MAKSTYTQAIAAFICDEITAGKTLTQIVDEKKRKGVPHMATIFRWLDEHDDFREAYMRARERQAHVFADQIVYLSDKSQGNDKISADKLRTQIDARKWHASKMVPTRFGEPILRRNRVLREEEDEHIRRMKDITPVDDGSADIVRDPKHMARILNYLMMKTTKAIEHKGEDDD